MVEQEDKPAVKPSWKNRRRMMWSAVAFCMLCIAWVLYKNLDSGPAEAAITMGFLTIGGIIGSYVFGAAWQDIKR